MTTQDHHRQYAEFIVMHSICIDINVNLVLHINTCTQCPVLHTSESSSKEDESSVVFVSDGFQLSSDSDVSSVEMYSSSFTVSSELERAASLSSSSSLLSDDSQLLLSDFLTLDLSPLLNAALLRAKGIASNAMSSLPALSDADFEHSDGVLMCPVSSAVVASNSALAFCALYLHRVNPSMVILPERTKARGSTYTQGPSYI